MPDTRPTPLDIARDACTERGYVIDNYLAHNPVRRGAEFRLRDLYLRVTFIDEMLTMHSTLLASTLACVSTRSHTDVIRQLINLHLDLLEADLKHA